MEGASEGILHVVGGVFDGVRHKAASTVLNVLGEQRGESWGSRRAPLDGLERTELALDGGRTPGSSAPRGQRERGPLQLASVDSEPGAR
jgi:hypothetical protein